MARKRKKVAKTETVRTPASDDADLAPEAFAPFSEPELQELALRLQATLEPHRARAAENDPVGAVLLEAADGLLEALMRPLVAVWGVAVEDGEAEAPAAADAAIVSAA